MCLFSVLKDREKQGSLGEQLRLITFYSPSCFGQETVKGLLRSSRHAATRLPLTVEGGFTLSLLKLKVEQESCDHRIQC